MAGVIKYWYSTPQWTVQVNVTQADIVVFTAPLLASFIGQPRDRIRRWCLRKGWPLEIWML